MRFVMAGSFHGPADPRPWVMPIGVRRRAREYTELGRNTRQDKRLIDF